MAEIEACFCCTALITSPCGCGCEVYQCSECKACVECCKCHEDEDE